LLLNVHTKKGASIKPKDLATFPWEELNNKNPAQGWSQIMALATEEDGKTR